MNFDPSTRLSSTLFAPLSAASAVLVFLFSVQLLGTATGAASPALEGLFRRFVVGDGSSLGLGWLGAYAIANGSVVAALAVSLFTVDILSIRQLFLMVVGSRLGAGAIVVVVGAFDYVQKRSYSLQKSVSMGVLTFLLTHSVYLPVAVVGYVAVPQLSGPFRSVGELRPGFQPLSVFDPLTVAVTSRLGPPLSFLLAVALLFGSLNLFDRALKRVETATLRRRLFRHLQHVWLSFAVGLLVTGVTTSVAFSLGVIVPLYNRGYVKRDELIPYVLGANLGTLIDTLLIAVLLGSSAGAAVVVVVLAIATAVTVALLVFHDRYSALVAVVDDRLLTDRAVFVAFVVSLVAVPVGLFLVPLAVGG